MPVNLGQPIKTRFLVLSDTHGYLPFPQSDVQHAYRYPLPKADVVLHAGDLSFHGKADEYERTRQVLMHCDAELKLVIAGNHDITLDRPYWMSKQRSTTRKTMTQQEQVEAETKAREIADQARQFWTGEEARQANVIYLEEGVHSFCLSNGAKLSVSR